MGNNTTKEKDDNIERKRAGSAKSLKERTNNENPIERQKASSSKTSKERVTKTKSEPTYKHSTTTTVKTARDIQKSTNTDGATQIVQLIENKKSSKLLVAAIDFGTTYSGYAFMMKSDYLSNKGDSAKIHCPTWIRDGGLTHKAPTSVLFKPDKSFHSFGYEAEKFYHDNSDNIDFKEWYFFKHFKMKLYTDKDILSKETVIEDGLEVGHTMKAIDVFAAVIKYFKQHLLDSFKVKTNNDHVLTNNDIHWVITVPAIWDLKAKQFMKDAAEKAGIMDDQLTLALEPEAASLYCRKVPVNVETTHDGGKAIAAMQDGSQYIVFDQGGGTTDITVHEVTGFNTLKEIHQACGGYYGGNTVNQEFYKILTKLFGGPVIQEIRKKHPSEYFDFMNNFEEKKTTFTEKNPPDDKSTVTLRIPVVWLNTYKEHTEETVEEALPNTTFKEKIVILNDKIRINQKLFRSFFDFSIDNVLKVFRNLFEKPEIAKITTLLAVGGYSESPVLIGEIKEKFPHLSVIVPRDPGLAVLKGAVLYGFEPHSITERVSRYTYGVAMQLPFDPDIHDHNKISIVRGRHGKKMVDDIFDKHVEIGHVLRIGEFQDEHDYFPLVNDQKVAHFEFYASELKNPKYVTDKQCQLIGTYHVELTRDSPQDGKLYLKLNASGTEIVAVVREDTTGKESRAYFSLF